MEIFNYKDLKDRFMDDNELIVMIIEDYKIQIIEQFETLNQLIQNEKWDDIKSLAHTIKGASLNLSFERMADIAKKIEFLEEKNREVFMKLQMELEKEYDILLKELKRLSLSS